MKIYDLQQNDTDIKIKVTDFENFFHIFKDKNNNYKYNLNNTVYINIADKDASFVKIDHPMHWSTISYKIYDTIHLAWLLMKLNNVSAADTFKRMEAGSTIKYIDKQYMQNIVSDINKMD